VIHITHAKKTNIHQMTSQKVGVYAKSIYASFVGQVGERSSCGARRPSRRRPAGGEFERTQEVRFVRRFS
jgi:hypothetical protein